MKEEIMTAVMFFIRFIEKSETFPRDQLENFKRYLTELLIERFEEHWFPNLPTKGQGYRCIRVNCVSPVDDSLRRAAIKCGLKYGDLRLPTELTVWVDPNEVCYRLGESEGSYCTLATIGSGSSSAASSLSSAASSSSESSRSTPTHSPPSTPHQERQPRRVQRTQQHQRYNNNLNNGGSQIINNNGPVIDYPNRYRNHHPQSNVSGVSSSSLRVTRSPREMNFNFSQNRPMYRCDGPPYPLTPAFFRNVNHNRTHKNVLRV